MPIRINSRYRRCAAQGMPESCHSATMSATCARPSVSPDSATERQCGCCSARLSHPAADRDKPPFVEQHHPVATSLEQSAPTPSKPPSIATEDALENARAHRPDPMTVLMAIYLLTRARDCAFIIPLASPFYADQACAFATTQPSIKQRRKLHAELRNRLADLLRHRGRKRRFLARDRVRSRQRDRASSACRRGGDGVGSLSHRRGLCPSANVGRSLRRGQVGRYRSNHGGDVVGLAIPAARMTNTDGASALTMEGWPRYRSSRWLLDAQQP